MATGNPVARIEAGEGGALRVSGELGFDSVAGLLAESRKHLAAPGPLNIDLSGVTASDSAGLALLIEWLRLAKQAGRPLSYAGVPEQLRALARISEVEDLLPIRS